LCETCGVKKTEKEQREDDMEPTDLIPAPVTTVAESKAKSGETMATAMAAAKKAAIEARCIIAERYKRDMDTVRARMLKECQRPVFAETAIYHKPIGKGIEGLSIRFAEAAVRCLSNIMVTSEVIYEDEQNRLMRVEVTDCNPGDNNTFSRDVMVSKSVERRNPRKGDEILGPPRQNSSGQLVYTIRATEDDMLTKQSAAESKAIRTLVLRLLPGDLQDEAKQAIYRTIEDQAAQDPDAEKKRLLDAFSSLGIQPNALREYVGHDLDALQPAQIAKLRGVYQALKDGEATWLDILGKDKDEKGGQKQTLGDVVGRQKEETK
jgi:hypothetical protein